MYFVSAGCGLSQTHREIMEDVSQTVTLGCEALQSGNTHFSNKCKLSCRAPTHFPHHCLFLTISFFLPGRRSVQRGHIVTHILPSS